MGLKKDSIRQKAMDYFIENLDATQAEVAELYRVTPKTLGEWHRKDDWEQKRMDYHTSPVKIKQLTQRELLSVAQGNAPKLPADTMSKLMAVLDRCDKKADPIVVARILKDLDNFICQINPALALEIVSYHKQFLMHRINLES
ncbi:hypothetical protein DBR40_09145 [Pedobacter sp. KBW01]|uniref:hypothetical protein n=1 Tax=Pedobacter sp. KBW01 TaxID=2153364 RepID=UPI000F5A303D|nr:hypothetical protein [Pedobacter sp. KBW01]RQO78105.1 hypothetical protein DBR40_09145 [Pedobacter sp. KBW01]